MIPLFEPSENERKGYLDYFLIDHVCCMHARRDRTRYKVLQDQARPSGPGCRTSLSTTIHMRNNYAIGTRDAPDVFVAPRPQLVLHAQQAVREAVPHLVVRQSHRQDRDNLCSKLLRIVAGGAIHSVTQHTLAEFKRHDAWLLFLQLRC
jgi:hypothetical protein